MDYGDPQTPPNPRWGFLFSANRLTSLPWRCRVRHKKAPQREDGFAWCLRCYTLLVDKNKSEG